MSFKGLSVGFAAALLVACSAEKPAPEMAASSEACPVELVVLGVGQDAGAPQIGNPDDPAWADPSKRLYATSLGLLDHENGKRYLFEATPDIREQMQIMDKLLPYDGKGPYIDGIFLTHAHIGHYAGLMFLGRESMGAKGVPVYAMPRMQEFLENNGPWSQLVELGNIELLGLRDGEKRKLGPLNVSALQVNHRDEFSETALYRISYLIKEVAFVPDIDSWDEPILPSEKFYSDDHEWQKGVGLLQALGLQGKVVDYAFIDATFYDDNELPGRDMSQIPHPRVTESMDLIDATGDDSLKDKVRFIHINHTNPLRDKNSDAYQEMTDRGYKLAFRGERFCL